MVKRIIIVNTVKYPITVGYVIVPVTDYKDIYTIFNKSLCISINPICSRIPFWKRKVISKNHNGHESNVLISNTPYTFINSKRKIQNSIHIRFFQ